MKSVPPIDSVYYEKVTISESDILNYMEEGCQVYLDTHDPTKQCKYYRWEFVETFPLPGLNQTHWLISETSNSWIVTYIRECADCTARGTNIKPDFWTEINNFSLKREF